MKATIPDRLIPAAICACLFTTLAACSSSSPDESNQDQTDRYHVSSEFLGPDQLLAVLRVDDDSNSLVFLRSLNADENAGNDEMLDREWLITPLENDFFRITNRGLGDQLSLDVVNDGVFDQLVMAPSADVSGQQWTITTLENGFCRFTNEFLGAEIALDITSDTVSPMLTLRPAGDFSGQHWQLTQLGVAGELDDSCTGGN